MHVNEAFTSSVAGAPVQFDAAILPVTEKGPESVPVPVFVSL